MKFILSRKGFDSQYGGVASPILNGRPLSLPIPGERGETTTYADIGLGPTVTELTGGRIGGDHACHHDPMFADGHCWFGQVNQAQGHLRNQGVGPGDVFLFFGLFTDPETRQRHHRIFGTMTIACMGHPDRIRRDPAWREPTSAHPHLHGNWEASNTIYHGPGRTASTASPALRLTHPDGPLNRWTVPRWLHAFGLTYHPGVNRWRVAGELDSAKRGQEFVCDIGDAQEPRRWLEAIIAEIEGRNVMT